MYTSEGLREIHRRTHESLAMFFDHCKSLTDDELNKKLDGFGFPTIQLQLHHSLSAEKYWVSVLVGSMDVSMKDKDYPRAADLETYRKEIFEATEAYLAGASTDELATARPMMTYGNKEKVLIPAHVIMRTVTHLFQHNGQIAAMCRLLGKPVPRGFDYPIVGEVGRSA